MLKEHIEVLPLMPNRCQQLHISLNLKKCIYCSTFGILLGHVVSKQGLLVDPIKIIVIIYLSPATSVHWLHVTLGHTCYDRKFIQGYLNITTPLEKV